jgi:hypothetical protein
MNAAAEIMPTLNGIPYFGSAKVIDYNPQKNSVNVKAQLMGSERRVQARLATQSPNPLSLDDEVLIAGSHLNEMYVIGIIATGSDSTQAIIKTSSGAYAALSGADSAAEKTIQVYSRRNELLFEYDPLKEHAIVNVRKGNLELRTEEGDIRLSSASAVRISGHCIEMNSNKLYATAGYARFVFDRLETMVDTLIEQAKNVYRTVTQLTQLRTGRMRTLVDETYQFKANKAFFKSEDDFKIKGEKIHLG